MFKFILLNVKFVLEPWLESGSANLNEGDMGESAAHQAKN